jgi:hypothetical protein
MSEAQAERQRRARENQSLFRAVNDRIKELNEVFDAFTPYGEWTCECDRLLCIERIRLTVGEYERLRQNPNRFAVAPDDEHVNREVERVVDRTDRYWVVEKIGAGAVPAGRHDRPAALND